MLKALFHHDHFLSFSTCVKLTTSNTTPTPRHPLQFDTDGSWSELKLRLLLRKGASSAPQLPLIIVRAKGERRSFVVRIHTFIGCKEFERVSKFVPSLALSCAHFGFTHVSLRLVPLMCKSVCNVYVKVRDRVRIKMSTMTDEREKERERKKTKSGLNELCISLSLDVCPKETNFVRKPFWKEEEKLGFLLKHTLCIIVKLAHTWTYISNFVTRWLRIRERKR